MSLENAYSSDGINRGEPTLENEHQSNNTTNLNTSSSDKWCKLSDIPVHGDTLTGKANNTIRILFKNTHSIVIPDNTEKNNKNKYKKSYLNNIFSCLEVDIFWGKRKDNSGTY